MCGSGHRSALPYKVGEHKLEGAAEGLASHTAQKPHNLPGTPLWWTEEAWRDLLMPAPSHCSASTLQLPLLLNPLSSTATPLARHQCGSETGRLLWLLRGTHAVLAHVTAVSCPRQPRGQGLGFSSEGELKTGEGAQPESCGVLAPLTGPPWDGPRWPPAQPEVPEAPTPLSVAVFSARGEETEGRAAAAAAKTREPDAGHGGPVRE